MSAERNRFLEGLNENIYSLVFAGSPTSYADVVDKAMYIEEGLRNRRSWIQPQASQATRENNNQKLLTTGNLAPQLLKQMRPLALHLFFQLPSSFCPGQARKTIEFKNRRRISASEPPHGRCATARILHDVRAPARNVCTWGGGHLCDQLVQVKRRVFARCLHATSSCRWGGGVRTSVHTVRAQPHETCAHGYRPAGAMPAGLCAQGVRDRRAMPAAPCERDTRAYHKVATPAGASLFSQEVVMNGILRFGGNVFVANLIRIVMWDFDCIMRTERKLLTSTACKPPNKLYRTKSVQCWDHPQDVTVDLRKPKF
ncbi:hypothetical protein F511_31647 [Dorcoceras hygrometricum]|uniref:Uncharacterized protein n=1 Tax=Dorcoceras hygrometricum TaxID=472368 RepID=A0A2Z7AX56_9LAMI|nr:hypothetical protein F511_31647 [Dorcoceras hygrometricum]